MLSAPLRTMKDRKITGRIYRDVEWIVTYSEVHDDCHSVSWTSKPTVYVIHKRNESKLYKYINSQVKISWPGPVASQDTSETNTPYPSSEQQVNLQESNVRIKSAMNQDGNSRKVCQTNYQNSEEDLNSSYNSVSSQDFVCTCHTSSHLPYITSDLCLICKVTRILQ